MFTPCTSCCHCLQIQGRTPSKQETTAQVHEEGTYIITSTREAEDPPTTQKKQKHKQTEDDEYEEEISTHLKGGERLTGPFPFGHNTTILEDE